MLHRKITSLSLIGHSFYFYVLPLVDAENDKITIMDSSLGGLV